MTIDHYTDVPKGKEKENPDPLSGRHSYILTDEALESIPRIQELNDRGAAIFIFRKQPDGQRNKIKLSNITVSKRYTHAKKYIKTGAL